MIPREYFVGVDLVRRQGAQSLKSAPKRRIKPQGLPVILYCLFELGLKLPDMAEEVEASGTIGHLFQLFVLHQAQRTDRILV